MAETVSCNDIYRVALALLCEPDPATCTEYAAGAPYHLAAFCCECAAVDGLYRRQQGLDPAGKYSSVAIGLDEPFPLTERLVPAAAAYLAAMLVLDENEELSDKLYGRYCDMMATLCSSIPGASEAITDVYGF